VALVGAGVRHVPEGVQVSPKAELHVLSAAFRLGGGILPLRYLMGERVVLWRRTIAFALDGVPGWSVARNELGKRLYHRLRRQEKHRIDMSWPSYREEYEARVARMKGGSP